MNFSNLKVLEVECIDEGDVLLGTITFTRSETENDVGKNTTTGDVSGYDTDSKLPSIESCGLVITQEVIDILAAHLPNLETLEYTVGKRENEDHDFYTYGLPGSPWNLTSLINLKRLFIRNIPTKWARSFYFQFSINGTDDDTARIIDYYVIEKAEEDTIDGVVATASSLFKLVPTTIEFINEAKIEARRRIYGYNYYYYSSYNYAGRQSPTIIMNITCNNIDEISIYGQNDLQTGLLHFGKLYSDYNQGN